MSTPVSGLTPGLLPHDLSPWGMFLAAHPVVQAVMIGLVLASVACWSVALAKSVELWQGRRRARWTIERLAAAGSLDEAARHLAAAAGPEAALVRHACDEVARSAEGDPAGLLDRVRLGLARTEAAAGRRMAAGTGLLASIGAVAPFVGLFGTVWGIMTSFVGIAQSQTTNLAVVAPGIAEALLATAIGLVAAIPAVVLYNAFARAIAGYRAQVGDAAAEVLRHVSRDRDRRAPRRALAAE